MCGLVSGSNYACDLNICCNQPGLKCHQSTQNSIILFILISIVIDIIPLCMISAGEGIASGRSFGKGAVVPFSPSLYKESKPPATFLIYNITHHL